MSGSVQLRTPPAEAPAEGNGSPPAARRPRRRLLWGAVALAVLAGAGLAAWALTDTGGGGSEPGGSIATGTAEAAVRDLVRTETFAGTLDFADTRRLAAGMPGTITALAPEGAIRRRGEVLYRIDQRPVVLLVGGLPAWRRLEEGVEGADVRQLERNLEALGYDPGAVDRRFDADTREAVEEWQADLGVEETGAVEPADVVFSQGAVRVGAHAAEAGQAAQPGATVLEISSVQQVVTVELDVADRTLVEVGDEVTVELPDESDVAGAIAAIGSVAEATTDETGTTAGSTIDVTIELAERAAGLDQAPVDVSVVTESKEGVLAVPVTALVALLGGGYAVEAPDGATTRLVAVKPGMYADGYVEIAGGELAEGDTVVVPQ